MRQQAALATAAASNSISQAYLLLCADCEPPVQTRGELMNTATVAVSH